MQHQGIDRAHGYVLFMRSVSLGRACGCATVGIIYVAWRRLGDIIVVCIIRFLRWGETVVYCAVCDEVGGVYLGMMVGGVFTSLQDWGRGEACREVNLVRVVYIRVRRRTWWVSCWDPWLLVVILQVGSDAKSNHVRAMLENDVLALREEDEEIDMESPSCCNAAPMRR